MIVNVSSVIERRSYFFKGIGSQTTVAMAKPPALTLSSSRQCVWFVQRAFIVSATMNWSRKPVDGGGSGGDDEEDTGGGSGTVKEAEWQRRRCQGAVISDTLGKWMMIATMIFFFYITGTIAVISNSTFKGMAIVFIYI